MVLSNELSALYNAQDLNNEVQEELQEARRELQNANKNLHLARNKLRKAQQEVDLYTLKSEEATFDISQITTKLFASQQAILSTLQNIQVQKFMDGVVPLMD